MGSRRLSPSTVLQTSLGRWNSKAAFTLTALEVPLFHRLCVVKVAYYVRYSLQIIHLLVCAVYVKIG